ncbi:MAG: hypothetical protein M3283_13830, partial [Actinomycetota bacterium]|nr:hypothetical protein [Actinomycetota bacterium]
VTSPSSGRLEHGRLTASRAIRSRTLSEMRILEHLISAEAGEEQMTKLSPGLSPAPAETYYRLTTGEEILISAKHLRDYVNEDAFRYNHREDDQAMFGAVVSRTRKARSGKHGKCSPIGEEG